RIEAVFAFAPVAVLLQPLAQDRHLVPSAGVDLFGERGDGFRTRRQRAEGGPAKPPRRSHPTFPSEPSRRYAGPGPVAARVAGCGASLPLPAPGPALRRYGGDGRCLG